MCEISYICTRVKCDPSACRYGCFLFAIMSENVCKSADLQHLHVRTHARCMRHACRCCNQSLFSKNSVNVYNSHICTRAKYVPCACRCCSWSLCAFMCAKVWKCQILHIRTHAKCVQCVCRCFNWSLFAINKILHIRTCASMCN